MESYMGYPFLRGDVSEISGSTTNSVREYEMDETTSMVCDGGVFCDSPCNGFRN